MPLQTRRTHDGPQGETDEEGGGEARGQGGGCGRAGDRGGPEAGEEDREGCQAEDQRREEGGREAGEEDRQGGRAEDQRREESGAQRREGRAHGRLEEAEEGGQGDLTRFADLHLHTYHSDGTRSPREVIDLARVEQLAAGGALGRPHVARALVERGYVASIGEAFDKLLGSGKPAYVERRAFRSKRRCR